MADYDISGAFKTIENELIDSMMRNFKRHRAEETKEGYSWTQWQAEQLKSLEEYKKRNAKKFKPQFAEINSKIDDMLRTAKADGNAEQEAKILNAIKNGFKAQRKPSEHSTGEFFKINERKLDALIKSTADDLKRAETAVLRMSNDKYRKAIFNAQVAMNTGSVTYEQAVDMACKDMLDAGLNCVEYKNGARHTLSDYADMAIRTANKRAYLRGEGEERAKYGLSLVVVNSRQGGCPKCAEYIGKVFIDDVYSGGTQSDGKYPLLSNAIAGGLFHPRCKDSTSTYYEGITTLSPVTAEEMAEMDRREQLEAQQQYAERQAQRFDRRAKYSLDNDNKRVAQARSNEWHDRADKLAEKTRDFTIDDGKQKYYKPVVDDGEEKDFNRKNSGKKITVKAHKATGSNDIYLSDKVKLKRKQFHKFDKNVTKIYEMLGQSKSENKPAICILSPEEMGKNAVATYIPTDNVLTVNSAYFTTKSLAELQKSFACPDSELSSVLHELIHWQDAEKYRQKFGEITDYNAYCDYLNKIYAPKVEKLINSGYNISDISEYAYRKMMEIKPEFDEIFDEYRVKTLLGE